MRYDPRAVVIEFSDTGARIAPENLLAVEAMKVGAFDYILKPFKLSALLPTLARAMDVRRLRKENLQLRETTAIYELGQAMAFTFDQATLLNKVADAALLQCEADEASVMVLAPEGDALRIAAVRGGHREHLIGERVPMGQGIAGWVALHQETLTLHGEVRDPRFTPIIPRPEIRSSISMPLLVGNKVVGVLNVNNTSKRRSLTLGQIKALSILGSLGAAVSETAFLCNQVAQSEAKYRFIFDNAMEGIFQSSPDGRFLTANPALARITGHESREELMSTIAHIGHQLHVDPDRYREWLRVMQEQGEVTRFESPWRRKDGAVIWVSENSRAVRNTKGEVLYFEGVLEDITERKWSGEQLRLKNAALEACANGIIITDREGVIVWVNPAFTALTGYTAQEVLGRNPRILKSGQHVQSHYRNLWETILAGQVWHGEMINRRKDGSFYTEEKTIAPVRVNDAGITHFIAISQDVTDRRLTEEALRQSEHRFRQLAENIRELFWLCSADFSELIYASPAYEQLTGRPVTSLYADPQSWSKTVHPEDHQKVAQAFGRVVHGGVDAAAVEFRIVRHDGSIRWLRGRAFPVFDGSRQVYRVAGIAEDITERRQLEEQLRQAQKMESVGALAGGFAHDFNNILTGINGFADLGMLQLTPDHPLYANLKEVRMLGQRAVRLTRHLLAFARKQVIQRKNMNLNDCISDLSKFLQNVIREDIRLDLILALDLATVSADETQIEQVLINLSANARDAMPGGGQLRIQTENVYLDETFCRLHPEAKRGNYVLMSVSDSGIGMDSDTLPRVFEPFFTTKGPGEGTGLGLSIVYGIVLQHNGLIRVYSEVGHGTTFRIYLPAVSAQLLKEVVVEVRALGGGSEGILVAEDEPAIRELIAATLGAEGYRVMTVADGEEALQLFQEHQGQFDLMISDVVMPRVGGRELYERLHERYPNLRFLFISGYSREALTANRLPNEELDLLSKPFSALELARKVREILDRRNPS